MPTVLTPAQLQHDLELRDLTDPETGLHAIQMLVDLAVESLAGAWKCEARRERGPRVVPLVANYDRLRYPPADITRDARYTRYVDEGHVLRSHSSAMIPPALARLAGNPADDSSWCARASPTAATASTASHRYAASVGPLAHHTSARRRGGPGGDARSPCRCARAGP